MENLKERDHLGHSGVEGSIIIKWILKKLNDSLNWKDLANDRDTYKAVVEAIMNFWVPKKKKHKEFVNN